MGFTQNLRQVWRHDRFRKLVAVRVASQAADGTVQVGMASYVLFSPQSQPNAWAIAAVLAITLLPFSVIGPFVSLVLDRWSRQRVVVVVDSIRCLVTLAIAALVATGSRSAGVSTALFGLLLVAMSLNRFVLAGLSAGLHYTVDEDEFLTASSVVPTIGPLGVVIGAVLAGAGRLILGRFIAPHLADAVVFCIAAALFVCSVLLASRIGRSDLGPEPGLPQTTASQIWTGLMAAFAHLRDRPAARLALQVLGAQRVAFGFIMVATILGYRNYFHTLDDVPGAMADLSVWAAVTGVGFILATAFVPQLTGRLGLRTTAIVLLGALAVVQVLPGSIFTKMALLVASFLLGLLAQSFKICVDTLVHAHVDADMKGRVFTIYDMVFNGAFVVAAVLAALVLPVEGLWLPAFLAVAVAYAGMAVWFAWGSARVGKASFEKGTGRAS